MGGAVFLREVIGGGETNNGDTDSDSDNGVFNWCACWGSGREGRKERMMNDPIERQAAIDGFWKLDIEIRPSAIDAITKMLMNLPSAPPEKCEDCENFNKTRLLIPQPERKKGHWIVINESAGLYECDQCHERVCCVGKYCMHCGSPMEVKE